MVDWLVLWGVQQLSGFAFKSVLEHLAGEVGDLAQDAGKDFVKDFFKDSLKSGLSRFQKDALAQAMGKAYVQFLYLVQQEIEASESSKAEIEQYNKPLELFTRYKSIKAWLAKAFEPGCQHLDPAILKNTWIQLDLESLPEDFSWGRISKLYLNRVGNIIGESQDLKDLFTAKKTGEVAENTKQLVGVIPDYDLERYRESIQDAYRHLKLSKLDSTYQDKSYKVKLWRIFIPQTVREALPPSRYDLPKEIIEKLKKEGHLEANYEEMDYEQYRQLFLKKTTKSVLEVVNDADCPYMVFVGDPGSGKSTLLQYLAVDWAENPTERLPLLIELREYAKDENQPKDFLGFFHEGKRKICELNQIQLDEQLKTGNALVMFDGLDEIFNNDVRGRVITEIHAFSNKYPQVKIIVTSRVIGYNPEDFENAGFRHFTLEEFDNSQIREFIKRWHQLALPDESAQDRQDTRKRLQTAIKDSPSIRQLAGNPLLLTMMAILNRYKELPRRRIDLYGESTYVLLYQWEIEYKNIEDLTLDDVDLTAKQEMLQQIAFRMQASEQGLKGNIIHRGDLEQEITNYYYNRLKGNKSRAIAGKIIEQLRKRDFILCQLGKDYYGFVHRTFLEYFCAMAFVDRFNKRGKEGGVGIEELCEEVFGRHWQDETWHEVLRLIAGNLNEFVEDVVDYLIGIFRERNNVNPLILAAECLREVDGKVALDAVSDRLLQVLKEALETDEEIIEKTGETSKRISEESDQELSPSEQLAIFLEKRRVERSGGKTAPEIRSRGKTTSEVINIIAKTITKYWQDKIGVMDWLENIALNHKKSETRRAISQGIADIKLAHLDNRNSLINNIGDVYYYQNQYEKAIAVYLQQTDSNSLLKLAQGQSYIRLKRFDEAIHHYQQWLKKEPKQTWAYDGLGRIYRESGRYPEAVEVFNRAIEISGKGIFTINHFQNLGWIYEDWGKYEEAIAVYQKAIDIDANSQLITGIYNYLGMAYDNLGQYDKAISTYQQAIKVDAKNSVTYNNLGSLYRLLQRWDDAIDSLNAAIELNPLNSTAYRNLGIVYLLQENWNEAEQAFSKAIKIDSTDGSPILSLGILQALKGDLQTAQASWQEGLKLYPEYAQDKRLYRTIYTIALGEIQQGLTNLQQILNQEKPPIGLLRYVLETAQLLQRCPQLTGIDDAVTLIQQAISAQ